LIIEFIIASIIEFIIASMIKVTKCATKEIKFQNLFYQFFSSESFFCILYANLGTSQKYQFLLRTKIVRSYIQIECKTELFSIERKNKSTKIRVFMLKQSCAFKVGFCILFFFDFGLSRLTSLQFIQYHVAGFYKPTIPQRSTLPFAGLQHMQQYQVRVFHKFLFKALIQMCGA
jgi:hypothetical protein